MKINPGNGWRLVMNGEKIKFGDEFHDWRPCECTIGMKMKDGWGIVRRRITKKSKGSK